MMSSKSWAWSAVWMPVGVIEVMEVVQRVTVGGVLVGIRELEGR